jgi:Xaa-Pro aminopeptidase
MDAAFYQENRRGLSEAHDTGLILVFGSSAPYKNEKGYYGRTLDMNFFYLTGLETPSAILALWRERGDLRECLFIEEPDPDLEKWSGFRMPASRAQQISGVKDIRYLSQFDEFLADALSSSSANVIRLDVPPWFKDDVPPPIDSFIRTIQRTHAGLEIDNISGTLARMRTVKRPGEIECIKAAVANAQMGIEAMLAAVRPGMYEYELQAVCYNLLHRTGEMKAAPMVASGPNAVVLHYPAADSLIREEDLVLVDFCPRSNQYASDISRAFPASGRFSERQKDLYRIALEANKRMIEAVGPGMTFQEMNDLARLYLGDGMLAIGLIKDRSEVERYYYHSVTHFLGLGIHDVGDGSEPIPEGAVLTIDAGVYVAEEGTGLRVEDDVLITQNGCQNLSTSIRKEVEDIEAMMAGG